MAEKATPVYSTAIGQVLGKTWRPEARKFVRSSSAHVRVSRSCAELWGKRFSNEGSGIQPRPFTAPIDSFALSPLQTVASPGLIGEK